ncbi:hypothetical protein [Solitalea koreensis]|uniref:Uncharacterized protein n=1 Tax=Solitalea koreensis TaxID=543615 RepID=A0A521AYN6_9SPHI|nr:hypothetical protein [Solitalea koreensis]SMO39944.1 hypothetical protein SAMN06265350_101525 [Solitalea koreensis]
METTETQTSSKNWIYILSALIVLLLGANAYLFFNKNDKEAKIITLSDEKLNLQVELNKMKDELSSVKALNTNLSDDMQAKEKELSAKIEELEIALRQGKLTAAQLSKAKSEISTLKNTINKYIADIEQLKQEKEILTAQNSSLKSSVDSVSSKNGELISKNTELSNTVSKASMLKAQSVTISTLKRKNSGKLVDVTRAKQLDKVVANINMVPNDLAVEGPHLIYMQIIDPSGKMVSSVTEDTSKPLMIGGEKIEYTTSTTIPYVHSNSNYAIEWLSSEGWTSGTYKVNIYTERTLIGSTTFTLK